MRYHRFCINTKINLSPKFVQLFHCRAYTSWDRCIMQPKAKPSQEQRTPVSWKNVSHNRWFIKNKYYVSALSLCKAMLSMWTRSIDLTWFNSGVPINYRPDTLITIFTTWNSELPTPYPPPSGCNKNNHHVNRCYLCDVTCITIMVDGIFPHCSKYKLKL